MRIYDTSLAKSNDINIIKYIIMLIISAITVFSIININSYISGILYAQNEIEIKSTELQIKTLALENYRNNKSLENKLINSVTAIKEKINAYPAIQNDIIILDSIFAKNDITTTQFKIGSVESYDYYFEFQEEQSVYYATVNITAHGNYYNVLSAYSEITNNVRWYDIKSVSLTSDEMQGDAVRIDIIFNIYFMEKTLPISEKIEPSTIFKSDNPFNY